MELAKTPPVYEKPSFIRRLKKDIRKNKYVYVMALPILIYYIIFHYVSMGGIVIAFQDYKPFKGITGSEWVGLRNFIDFFTGTYAARVIRNTIAINIYDILFGFPAPIILALLINEVRSGWFKRTIQTVSYMPYFISMVVVCGMIVDFTKSDGFITNIVTSLGGARVNLLMDKDLFRTIFVSSGIWQNVGWGSIIYLATLSSIDPSLYEAAVIDGAGRFRQLIHITLPALIPTITILLILRLGNIMETGFEKVILLYNPLTYETGDVISSFVFRRGLQESSYSYGASVGLFNSIVNCTILFMANYASRKVTNDSLW
jgi:putative aldouronate transport system permease protein